MSLNLIEFKKTVSGTLQVSDTFKDLFISNTYFSLTEDNYPFDSVYFKKYLEDGLIIVVKIHDGVKNTSFFNKFLKTDKDYEAQKALQNKFQEERNKLAAAKAKIRLDKIAAEEKAREVVPKVITPIIIEKDKINSSIENYFSQED